jgi:hypothetical protein
MDDRSPPNESQPDEPADALGFLFATPGVGPWGDPLETGGALHRLLTFLSAVAGSFLTHERVIDEQISFAFRSSLREPSLSTTAQLLETLLAGRKVRAADLLGIVPVESSRSLALTRELREHLRSLRRELEAKRGAKGEDAESPAAPTAPALRPTS